MAGAHDTKLVTSDCVRPQYDGTEYALHMSVRPVQEAGYREQMTSDLDICRAAKLLIDRHGENAPAEAMKRADALAAQGDTAGKVVWLRILEANEELRNTVPAGPVH